MSTPIHHVLYIVIKMEEYLIDYCVVKTLFSCDPEKELQKFNTVNTLVHGETIAGALYEMYSAICGTSRRYWYCHPNNPEWEICKFNIIPNTQNSEQEIYKSNIISNIHKLLTHDDIDYSIEQNKCVLKKAILPGGPFSVDDPTCDKILTKYNLNPDTVFGGNSISELVHSMRTSAERVITFHKHGANPDLHTALGPPYFFARKREILDAIVERTAHFDGLGDAVNEHHSNVTKIFTSILRYGKISAFEYLDKNKENIKSFESWIKSIRNNGNLDIQTMRIYFNTPIQRFSIIDYNKNVNDIVRKMVLFKCNLECLAQSTITVPAYKYYDVAIIILFFMRNQYLTVLTCDVLRYIAVLVFS